MPHHRVSQSKFPVIACRRRINPFPTKHKFLLFLQETLLSISSKLSTKIAMSFVFDGKIKQSTVFFTQKYLQIRPKYPEFSYKNTFYSIFVGNYRWANKENFRQKSQFPLFCRRVFFLSCLEKQIFVFLTNILVYLIILNNKVKMFFTNLLDKEKSSHIIPSTFDLRPSTFDLLI